MSYAIPPEITQDKLYQLVLARPVMIEHSFKLNVDLNDIDESRVLHTRITELYINAVFEKLNTYYGFSFASPFQARKVSETLNLVQAPVDKTKTCVQDVF